MFDDGRLVAKRPNPAEMLRRGGPGCASKIPQPINNYSKSELEKHAQVKYCRMFCPTYYGIK
jgi:hypothetical protein